MFRFTIRSLLILCILFGTSFLLFLNRHPYEIEKKLLLNGVGTGVVDVAFLGPREIIVKLTGGFELFDLVNLKKRAAVRRAEHYSMSYKDSIGISKDGICAVMIDETAARLITFSQENYTDIPLDYGYLFVTFSPVDKTFALAHSGGWISIHRGTAEKRSLLNVHTSLPVKFDAKGDNMVFTDGQKMRTYSVHTDGSGLAMNLDAPDSDFRCMSFSNVGDLIAGAASDGHIFCWDAQTKKQRYAIQGDKSVKELQFSPDDEQILTISEGVRVWSSSAGKALFEISDKNSKICAATYSVDNKRIIVAFDDGTIRHYDAKNGKLFTSFPSNDGGDQVFAVSSDEAWIVTAKREADTCIIWKRKWTPTSFGIFVLPEFWAVILFTFLLLWSLLNDRKLFMLTPSR